MANKRRRVANRTPRRFRQRRQRRNGPRLPRAASKNTRSTHLRIPVMRDFCIYPAEYSTGLTRTSGGWLEWLKVFGAIALKLFIIFATSSKTLLRSGKKVRATNAYVSGSVQSIFVGAEDLIWASPLVEREEKRTASSTVSVPVVDYRQARMVHCTVKITPGGALKERAGRYVVCLLDITDTEWNRYKPTARQGPMPHHDSWTFNDVMQMAGAVTAPYGTPVTLTWRARPSVVAYRFLEMGEFDIDGLDYSKNIWGGRPCFRLVIGYMDFASGDGKIGSLYSASEAMLHVDMRSELQLREPGRQYIRSWPIITMDYNSAGVLEHGRYKGECVGDLEVIDGALYAITPYEEEGEFEVIEGTSKMVIQSP